MSDRAMQIEEYTRMADVEDRMWWYRALHRNMRLLLDRGLSGESPRLLDAGCGTGGFLKRLAAQRPGWTLEGLELWPPACEMARARSGRPVTEGSVNELPFPDATFDAVVSADVLEEKGVEPLRAAREAWRCLRPGGLYVINVPAYEWLTSYHDRQVGVQHRFVRRKVVRLLRDAGFKAVWASYWNTLPFPLAVIRRKWLKPREGESDVRDYAPWLERLFGAMMAAEHAALRLAPCLPFGLSILAAGEKPHEAHRP